MVMMDSSHRVTESAWLVPCRGCMVTQGNIPQEVVYPQALFASLSYSVFTMSLLATSRATHNSATGLLPLPGDGVPRPLGLLLPLVHLLEVPHADPSETQAGKGGWWGSQDPLEGYMGSLCIEGGSGKTERVF